SAQAFNNEQSGNNQQASCQISIRSENIVLSDPVIDWAICKGEKIARFQPFSFDLLGIQTIKLSQRGEYVFHEPFMYLCRRAKCLQTAPGALSAIGNVGERQTAESFQEVTADLGTDKNYGDVQWQSTQDACDGGWVAEHVYHQYQEQCSREEHPEEVVY